ncbi:MAG: DUF2244 domain-containing protein [Pseudomonadota bacterium]
MSDATTSAAGERSPAASVAGPNWRDRKDRPIYQVELWPNQSLTQPGLIWFLGISAAFLALPAATIIGTAVFWGLTPFLAIAFLGIWFAIRLNGRNLSFSETLWIWRDEIRVERREPNGRRLRWQAEPFRVRLRIHKDAKIEDYLTLSGGGRIIELGAFLAPSERIALADEIESALTRAVRA